MVGKQNKKKGALQKWERIACREVIDRFLLQVPSQVRRKKEKIQVGGKAVQRPQSATDIYLK